MAKPNNKATVLLGKMSEAVRDGAKGMQRAVRNQVGKAVQYVCHEGAAIVIGAYDHSRATFPTDADKQRQELDRQIKYFRNWFSTIQTEDDEHIADYKYAASRFSECLIFLKTYEALLVTGDDGESYPMLEVLRQWASNRDAENKKIVGDFRVSHGRAMAARKAKEGKKTATQRTLLETVAHYLGADKSKGAKLWQDMSPDNRLKTIGLLITWLTNSARPQAELDLANALADAKQAEAEAEPTPEAEPIVETEAEEAEPVTV